MSALIASFILLAAAATPIDLSGKWSFAMRPDFRGNPGTVECAVKHSGTKITVRCGKGVEMSGQVTGRRITFSTPAMGDDHVVASYTAELLSPTSFKGTWHLSAKTLNERGNFSAVKHD